LENRKTAKLRKSKNRKNKKVERIATKNSISQQTQKVRHQYKAYNREFADAETLTNREVRKSPNLKKITKPRIAKPRLLEIVNMENQQM
jgi:hypothetical protein